MGNGSSAATGTEKIVQVQPRVGAANSFSQPQQPSYGFVNNNQQLNYYNRQHEIVNTDCGPDELDEGIESALAPQVREFGLETHKPRLERHHGKKEKQRHSEKRPKGNNNRATSANVEIVFEVFHDQRSGREYTVINMDGTRFYLDSWATDEWQPFPDEWLSCGFIQSNDRNNPQSQNVSTSDVRLDETWNNSTNEMNDDRLGFLDHPTKGHLMTYFFEEHRNVHCMFDPASGTWFKLPLSWELHSPPIKEMIDSIQDTLPTWTDRHDILAMLRQCNYNSEEVVSTYLSILHGDYWQKRIEKSNPVIGESDLALEHKNSEITRLKRKVTDLEAALESKDSLLEQSLEVERRLKYHLDESDSTINDLYSKVTGLKRELIVAEKKLTEAKPTTPKPTPMQSPMKANISMKTASSVKMSFKLLFNEVGHLREVFSRGRSEVIETLQQASKAINSLQLNNKSHDSEIEELKALYHKEALHRKLLYNKLQELRGNIRVFCRCRRDPTVEVAVTFPSDQEIQAVGPSGRKTFMFDRVFTPDSTQEQVFEDTLPLIASCVDGYNVCIMAYGQTGAGKTFTMMGPEDNPGVNVRSILELLRVCNERPNVDYTLSLAMLEVYNETLKDLLEEFGSCAGTQLSIQLKGKQVVVPHLTEIQVNSAKAIRTIMAKGDANRSVGATKMNTSSSRSHLVLILHINGVDKISHAITHSTLTLVDLAGSERISKTEATGQRLVEAAAINKSLSALGQVFTALRTNAMHVPYRNSKLTQLLQGSLGGDGKACMFVNVSPAEWNLSETISTLQFGAGAKQVQLGKATQNITRAQVK
ncbi:predicted protein [Nematostella vectensis]|uniref:Kinesin-like protein n=1 Tax=Nematostella vectensis TaxID=45351 RepID=A7SXF7_NEMVE|nr:predicted protein [Nematostella vectensis]|eukprot:XP_001623706.1 predicted protein [Nematostella vectensis]